MSATLDSTEIDVLAAAGEPGTTVVTANNRLARTLRRAFNEERQRGGATLWDAPDILPWTAWLERAWKELVACAFFDPELTPRVLLGSSQELALWETIIQSSRAGRLLLQTATAARLARDAWRLAHAWRIPLTGMDADGNEDLRSFRSWAAAYSAWCAERGAIDAARLPEALADPLRAGRLRPPERLVLAGFDELTPQQRQLLQVLETAGAGIREAAAPAVPGAAATRLGFADTESEVRAAAYWVRARLGQDPAARIAVVVPELEALRSTIARVFDEVLTPGVALSAAGADPVYNISLGRPLSDYPVLRAALGLLGFAQADLPLDQAGALLRSPFLPGADAELTARAILDAELRRRGETVVAPADLRRLVRNSGSCPQLGRALERWWAVIAAAPRRQLPSAWAETVLRALAAAGWPGDRGLDSAEYQTVEAWRGLVSGLAALDAVTGRLDYPAAVARLRRLAADSMFQPETPPAPVQVLGVLESSGLDFDHLWVLGLHDGVWPRRPDPNPFLPLALQRRLAVARASAERELTVARRSTARLLAGAAEVRVSHPLRDGEHDLRPSPLIVQLAAVEWAELGIAQPPAYRRLVQAAGRLEVLADSQGPPLSGIELEAAVPGGSAVFKQQAACPFRAFAEFRLHARPLHVPQPGLDAAERGSLLHQVLERVWKEIGSSAALADLTEEGLAEIIHRAAEEVIGHAARRRPATFTERFARLERERLQRRVREWLELERGRPPFTVEDTERRQELVVGGVRVLTRIDRVDLLPDGGRAIIDYKTGEARIEGWYGERPDEPQLPLYSLAAGPGLAATLFARLRPGAMGYAGLAAYAGVAPGVTAFDELAENKRPEGIASWEGLQRHWEQVLQRLGTAFRSGAAAVDPKDPPATCAYCELTPLCRINELTVLGDGGPRAAQPLDGEDADD